MGQAVTWLVPHNYNVMMPGTVDYNVMMTFLEFYTVRFCEEQLRMDWRIVGYAVISFSTFVHTDAFVGYGCGPGDGMLLLCPGVA